MRVEEKGDTNIVIQHTDDAFDPIVAQAFQPVPVLQFSLYCQWIKARTYTSECSERERSVHLACKKAPLPMVVS